MKTKTQNFLFGLFGIFIIVGLGYALFSGSNNNSSSNKLVSDTATYSGASCIPTKFNSDTLFQCTFPLVNFTPLNPNTKSDFLYGPPISTTMSALLQNNIPSTGSIDITYYLNNPFEIKAKNEIRISDGSGPSIA